MPIQEGSYISPNWKNDAPPAIDAAEMNAISGTIESLDSMFVVKAEYNG